MTNPIAAGLEAGGVLNDPTSLAIRLKQVSDNALNAYENQQKQWDAARSLFASRGLMQPDLQAPPTNLDPIDALSTTAGKAAFMGNSPVNPGTSSLSNFVVDIGHALGAAGKQSLLDTQLNNANANIKAKTENLQRLTDLNMYKPTVGPGAAIQGIGALLAAHKPLNLLPYQQDQETIDSKFLPPEFKVYSKTGQVTGLKSLVAGPTIPMQAQQGKLIPANKQQYNEALAQMTTGISRYNDAMIRNLQARQAAGLHGVMSTPMIVTAEHYSSAGFVGGPSMQFVHMRVNIPPELEQILPPLLKAADYNLTTLQHMKLPENISRAVAMWMLPYRGALENPITPDQPPNLPSNLSTVPPAAFSAGTGGY